MINELRLALKEELSLIKDEAMQNRSPYLRFGQDVFNKCYIKFPSSVDKLRGTNYDCFYQDSKVDSFLEKLENLLIEKILE